MSDKPEDHVAPEDEGDLEYDDDNVQEPLDPDYLERLSKESV
jgi:hypothetical protein